MKRTELRPRVYRNKGLRARVFERDGGRCACCGRYDKHFQVDHVRPIWQGGADTLENVQTLCRACHMRKTVGEAPVRAKADRCRARHELTALRKPSRGPGEASAVTDGASPPNPPEIPHED